MKLYGYFRSSAAYRVRIGLNLKGIEYENISINLREQEQRNEEFMDMNPQGLIPVLKIGDTVLTQSLAILEFLEDKYPEPSLLPETEPARAYVRAIALSIACDIHPLNNLRVLNYLDYNLTIDNDQRNDWYQYWISVELGALESRLASDGRTGKYCYGDTPTIADVCLVPQVANARRFNCDLSAYPKLVEIDARCNELEAFENARPEYQPDAK